tara:strand:+ start:974 stop:1453 length:480 start_codon:yes stop_codon:yes gene_type:complete
MSDNDFPEAPKLKPKTLKQICQDYPRELWWTDGEDGEVKQAPDWILTEAVEELSHIDATEDRNEFVYESLAISGDWAEFSSLLLRHCKENPESELAQFWEKWSKHRVQYLIERAEDTDFMISTAYKEAEVDWNENSQEDWQANEFEIIEIKNYLNRKGE